MILTVYRKTYVTEPYTRSEDKNREVSPPNCHSVSDIKHVSGKNDSYDTNPRRRIRRYENATPDHERAFKWARDKISRIC